ncbi:MAG TPA: CusA/CzcA family heavy metal efflux RND transporter [Candidatus Hydrogenedentes bacterium]|nr:CusA/CzcA family heavy metal efflux RND transporter [Candidatus Hydrogenedentota bacterium]
MLSHVIKLSIQHRWLVLILTAGAAVLGFFSLLRLPIDAVPDISNKIVQITTLYPALSPGEVEKQIAFPIETALAGIPGLRSTRSLTRNGFSQVEAIFEDEVDIYFARQQVMERLAEARESLPSGAEPRMGPITTGLGEVYVYVIEYEHPDGKGSAITDGPSGWQSDGSYLTPEGERLKTEVELAAYLRTLQDWLVKPQLRTVKDVAGVDTIGGYEKQYLVQPDPMKLVSYGLTMSDLVEALERNNASTGAGFIEHQGEALNVRADGRVRTSDDIGAIVLGSKDGTPFYVRDVASVGMGKELRTGAASQNGREVVVGTVLMLLGGNSRTVAASVTEKVNGIQSSLPPDIRLRPVLVRTELVDKTINTVGHSLSMGAILVIVVLLALLGNVRAAIITAMAIPLAMLMTAFGMTRLGISGNLMSLGAIDFGLIVDGAVIIVENCLRMMAEKQRDLGRTLTRKERLHEVFTATKQMIQPSVAGQAIIITVYLPILALTGVEGKMFHPMALTVICALVGAFVLSLTFVPAMVAIFITGQVKEKESWIVSGLKWLYAPALRWTLKLRWAVMLASVIIFAGSLMLFTRLGQEFVPKLDEGNMSLQSLRIPSTSLTQSQAMQFNVEKAVSALPEVALMYSKTGTAEVAFDPMPPNISDGYVILKPREQWPDPNMSKADLVDKIRKTVATIPGNLFEYSQPIELRINELVAGVRGDLAIKVFGDDFEGIAPIVQQVIQIVQSVPGAADVKAGQTEGFPSLSIDINRKATARHGLNVADVQDIVATAVGGREAGLVFEGDRRFDIVVRLPEELRSNLNALEQLPVPLPRSEGMPAEPQGVMGRDPAGSTLQGTISLGSIATLSLTEGLGQINREDGKRRLVVQANVRGRDLGSFVAEVRKRIDSEVKLTPGTWLVWGGQYENLLAARERLMIVVPFCFFMIFLFLFTTFNSTKYAILVFSGVPLALTGGIAALWLRGIPFSISAAVGFIALSGVAVLNGLVMVTYINHLRMKGVGLEDAILQGSLTRLRPVMMTALVASLGFVPMAMSVGTGAEVQKPLATVVIGGIISSTLLTLIVLPALYRLWHRKDDRLADDADKEHLEHAEVIAD